MFGKIKIKNCFLVWEKMYWIYRQLSIQNCCNLVVAEMKPTPYLLHIRVVVLYSMIKQVPKKIEWYCCCWIETTFKNMLYGRCDPAEAFTESNKNQNKWVQSGNCRLWIPITVTPAILIVSIRHCLVHFSCYFPHSQHCSILKSDISPLSHIFVIIHQLINNRNTI